MRYKQWVVKTHTISRRLSYLLDVLHMGWLNSASAGALKSWIYGGHINDSFCYLEKTLLRILGFFNAKKSNCMLYLQR